MSKKQYVAEMALGRFAKNFREHAGKTRAQAARELGVAQTSIFQAEEMPEQGLVKLRVRMIEKYSSFKVDGPVFYLSKRK
jgi:DNA-binding XRE family transcriptional regulator